VVTVTFVRPKTVFFCVYNVSNNLNSNFSKTMEAK